MRHVEVIDDGVTGCHISGVCRWWLKFDEKGEFVVAVGLDRENTGVYWGPYCDDCRRLLAPIIERGKTLPNNPAIESDYNRHTRALCRKNSEYCEQDKCERLLGERGLALEERDGGFIVTRGGKTELSLTPANPNERWYSLWAHLAYSPPIRFCELDPTQLDESAMPGTTIGSHLLERLECDFTYYLEVDRFGNVLRIVATTPGTGVCERAGCVSPIPPVGERTWPLAAERSIGESIGPTADLRSLMWHLFAKNPENVKFINAADFEKVWEQDRDK